MSDQISIENLTKVLDHVVYIRGQLMNLRAVEGLNENVKFTIFRCVELVRKVEVQLTDERGELPVPGRGAE